MLLKKFSVGSFCLHNCFSTPVNFGIDMISANRDPCTYIQTRLMVRNKYLPMKHSIKGTNVCYMR